MKPASYTREAQHLVTFGKRCDIDLRQLGEHRESAVTLCPQNAEPLVYWAAAPA